VSFVITLDK